MEEEKYYRLAKVAGEIGVGIQMIVEHLQKKGFTLVDTKPTAKLNQAIYEILIKDFQTEKKEKDFSKKIELQIRRDTDLNVEDESVFVKDLGASREIIKVDGLKALGKIDLSKPNLLKDTNQEDKIGVKPNNPMENTYIKMPIQKILFGSPGTGKSFTISGKENPNSYLKKLGITNDDENNCIKTVFHPEYTYGDFMGKLLPLTDLNDKITYYFYEGHFLKALAQSYINYLNKVDDEIKNVVLVIDEINRGNSAAIFGTAFQLLDRNADGFSEYEVNISRMEFDRLITLVFTDLSETMPGAREKKINSKLKDHPELSFLLNRTIKLPPNFHLIATMNTSDSSIYFMDSAFKRRWDWEFIDVTSSKAKQSQSNRKLEDQFLWTDFVDNINEFIKTKCKIRKIEDKQIGYYFIKTAIVTKSDIQNKLMFFLWDSVFNNDKRPLERLLNLKSSELVTFGDFVRNTQVFIDAIKSKSFSNEPLDV